MAQVRFNAPGDHYDVIRTVTLIPTGDSIARAWLTVKRTTAEADIDALVQLEITTANTASGQVTDTGAADATGAVTFRLTPTHTRLIGVSLRYYDIQIKSLSGKVYTAETGDIAAEQNEITVVDV